MGALTETTRDKAETMDTATLIQTGMERAFFVCAWADQAEESGHQFAPQERIDLSAPEETDPAAVHAARTLRFDTERKFGADIVALFEANRGEGAGAPLDPERWGWYAAMGAMGHGVGLWDYYIELDVPHVDFGSYSLERDYFEVSDG